MGASGELAGQGSTKQVRLHSVGRYDWALLFVVTAMLGLGIAVAVGATETWLNHSASTGNQTYEYTGNQTYLAAFLGSSTVDLPVYSAISAGDFGWAAEGGKTIRAASSGVVG